jgi:hypothetical protein
MKKIKDITELHIGMTIADKKSQFPMKVVGIFCSRYPKLDNDKDVVYADFEGNEGDVFEYSINEIYIEDGKQ